MGIPAYIKHFALALLFTLAAINFTRTTFEVVESSKRLDELRNSVVSLEEEKMGLEEELEYKKTDEFIESEARNKFGFVKEGEEIFVYPQVLSSVSYSAELTQSDNSNVQKWLNLFF